MAVQSENERNKAVVDALSCNCSATAFWLACFSHAIARARILRVPKCFSAQTFRTAPKAMHRLGDNPCTHSSAKPRHPIKKTGFSLRMWPQSFLTG